jgi:hypothetical protein
MEPAVANPDAAYCKNERRENSYAVGFIIINPSR